MKVIQQKQIKLINDCGCLLDENELISAILWYQKKPTAQRKHIYMHAAYPTVSIHKEKLHIHRLLMLYWNKGNIPIHKQVHHKNGNKLDARRSNLILVDAGKHQSMHNKGMDLSQVTRDAIIKSNHLRKGCRMKRKRDDVTPKMNVKDCIPKTTDIVLLNVLCQECLTIIRTTYLSIMEHIPSVM